MTTRIGSRVYLRTSEARAFTLLNISDTHSLHIPPTPCHLCSLGLDFYFPSGSRLQVQVGQVERFVGLCCAAAYNYQSWTLPAKVLEAIPWALVSTHSLLSGIFSHFQDPSSSQDFSSPSIWTPKPPVFPI